MPWTPRRSSWLSPRRASSSRTRRWFPSAPRPAPVSTSCDKRWLAQPPRCRRARARRRLGSTSTAPSRSRAPARSSPGRCGRARLRRRRAARRAVGPARARPQRAGARRPGREGRGRAAGRGQPARDLALSATARRRARRARRLSGQLAPRRRPRGTGAGAGRGHRPHRHERRRRPRRAEGRFAQLRLREPVVAARGDRVVLRTETTVGGGVVLDRRRRAASTPPGSSARKRRPGGDRPRDRLRAGHRRGAAGRGLLAPAELARGLAAVESAGDWFFAPDWLEEQRAAVRGRLAERASTSPLDPGIPLGELLPHEPWAPAVLRLLHVERRDGKAYAPGAAPKLGDQAEAAAELEAKLATEDWCASTTGTSRAFSRTEAR